MEAVKAALGALPQGSVVLRYLLAAPNDITISDVDLAAASKGLVLGFNVDPSEAVLAAAKHQGASHTSTALSAIVTPLCRVTNGSYKQKKACYIHHSLQQLR